MGDETTWRIDALEKRVGRIEDRDMQTEIALVKSELHNVRSELKAVKRWLVLTASTMVTGSLSFAIIALKVFG